MPDVSVVTADNLGADFDVGVVQAGKVNVRRAGPTTYGLIRLNDIIAPSGVFTILATSTMVGSTVDSTSVGATTPSTGAFTSLTGSTVRSGPDVTAIATETMSASKLDAGNTTGVLALYNTGTTVGTGAAVNFATNTNASAQVVLASIAAKSTDTAGTGDLTFTTVASAVFSEKARLTGGGQLLIGSTTARAISGATRQLQIEAAGAAGLALVRNSSDANGPTLSFAKTDGATVGSVTAVALDDSIGQVIWTGADGIGLSGNPSAQIQALVDGAVATNSVPTRLTFWTTTAAATTAVERMRITSAGNVGIGETVPTQKLHVGGGIQQNNNQFLWGKISNGTATRLIGVAATDFVYVGGVDAATIGTLFVVNSLEKMRLNSTGLGIGGIPGSLLDVAATSSGTTVDAIRIKNNGSGGNTRSKIGFYTAGSEYAVIDGGYGSTAPALTFSLPSATAGAFQWTVTSAEIARLDTTGFGLGRTATYSVDVQKDQNAISATRISNASAGSGADARMIVSNGTVEAGYILRGTGHTLANQAVLYVNGANPLTFFVNGLDRARIDSNGNLSVAVSGLSTTVSDKLSVLGSTNFLRGTLTSYIPTQILVKAPVVQITGGANSENDQASLGLVTPGIGFSTNRGSELYFVGSRATPAQLAASTFVPVQASDRLGSIYFGGDNSVTLRQTGAIVQGVAIETWSAATNAARLEFHTTISGATNPSLRGIFDSTGAFVVGSTSPKSTQVIGSAFIPLIQSVGLSGTNPSSGLGVIRYAGTTAAASPAIVLGRSRGTTDGDMAITASGDTLGYLTWNGSDGVVFQEAVRVVGKVDGTPVAGQMPGRLEFYTSPAGAAATPQLRMTLDSAGNLGLGTAPTAAYQMTVQRSDGTLYASSSGALASPAGGSILSVDNQNQTDGNWAGLVLSSKNALGVSNISYIGSVSGLGVSGGVMVFGRRTAAATYAESMRIDTSGRVMIGNTNGTASLTVGDATAGTKQIQVKNLTSTLILGTSGGAFGAFTTGTVSTVFTDDAQPLAVFTNQSQNLLFGTGAQERARIDTSGNLLVGATALVGSERLNAARLSAGAVASTIVLQNTGTTVGTGAGLNFVTNTGTASAPTAIAGISAVATTTTGSGDLTFITAVAGTAAPKMTLYASGQLSIGTLSATASVVLETAGDVSFRSSKTASVNSNSRVFGGAFTGNLATIATLTGTTGANVLALGGGTAGGEPATTIQLNIGTAGTAAVGSTIATVTSTGVAVTGATSSTSFVSPLYTSAAATAMVVDSGTTGTLGFGTGANQKTITIGNVTGTTGLALNSGTGGVIINQVAASVFNVSANAVKTTDQVQITNAGFPTITAGANALAIIYTGGAAAVEAGAMRVDFTPGGTTGGTWNALRFLPTVAAATGVIQNIIKVDAITAGAGTDNVINVLGTGYDTVLTVNGTTVINGTGQVIAAQVTGAVASATASATTTIAEDTTTNASMFLTWVTANTGNLPQKTTSTKLTFNPSTGTLVTTVLSTPGDQTISGTGKMGYSTGSGGAVTQLTSKATGVTLSKTNGAITMNAASLAASTAVSFILTNTTIAVDDCPHVCIKSGGTLGAYSVSVDAVAAGNCTISLRNLTAGALAEAVVLTFVVFKAAVA